MQISEAIRYVGVNDRRIDLFEGQFVVPNGMAYNSYVILDDKVAVMDSVEASFGEEWLDNIRQVLGDRAPDYLVVLHMEPDHSANIAAFAAAYPDAVLVASDKAFAMMNKYFGTDYVARRMVVKEGDTLSLGAHTLQFFAAPMVHWPEVLLAYEQQERVLFSADAFGKFGTTDTDEDWACEARRYYFGIVGKYGVQVQSLLKKLSKAPLTAICPLHGPVLKENLGYYIDLYNTWSSYGVESEGVFIAYTSVYGHTKVAVERLAEELRRQGCPKVAVADLAREDMAEAVEDAFRYGKLVLATTTYNGEIFPFMSHFIHALVERNYQKRTVGFIENGSWAPVAAKTMRKMLENSKELTFTDTTVTIHAAMTAENEQQIAALAQELCR